MWKPELLFLFFAFLDVLKIVISKDEIKEKNHAHQKLLQKHHQKIKEKCGPERCYVICPFDPIPDQLFDPAILSPNDDPYEYYGESEDRLKKHSRHAHALTKRQKQALLNQFRIGNQNGKKAYNFRQFSSGCYVRCNEYQLTQQIPQTGTLLPPVVANPPSVANPPYVANPPISVPSVPSNNTNTQQGDDDDDDVDEPYRPGEDTPIEATASPPEKRRHAVKGKYRKNKSYQYRNV